MSYVELEAVPPKYVKCNLLQMQLKYVYQLVPDVEDLCVSSVILLQRWARPFIKSTIHIWCRHFSMFTSQFFYMNNSKLSHARKYLSAQRYEERKDLPEVYSAHRIGDRMSLNRFDERRVSAVQSLQSELCMCMCSRSEKTLGMLFYRPGFTTKVLYGSR